MRNTLSYLIDPLDSTDEVLTTLCNAKICHNTDRNNRINTYMRPAAALIFVYIQITFYVAATISGTDTSMSIRLYSAINLIYVAL